MHFCFDETEKNAPKLQYVSMIGNVIIHKKLYSYIDVRATYDVPNCMGAATKYNITELVGYHDFMFQWYHVAEVGIGPYFASSMVLLIEK